MTEIRAADYIDPDGLIVRSGELLAERAIPLLRSGEQVLIELRGLSGISSSYFNAFLRLVREQGGDKGLASVRFNFVSPLQQQVYERSLRALQLGAAEAAR